MPKLTDRGAVQTDMEELKDLILDLKADLTKLKEEFKIFKVNMQQYAMMRGR